MENEVLDELDQPIDESLLLGEEGDEQGEQQEVDPVDEQGQEEQEQKPAEEDMPVVPRARFNEVNEERKALKAQLEQLQGQAEQRQESSIDMKALRRQATEALLDGNMDKHDEIQDLMQSEILRQAESQAEARMMQRAEFDSFQSKAAALSAEFPVLDAESGDPEAISMVIELRDAYIAKGMGMTQALESAARKVAPLFGSKPAAGKPDERTLKAVKRGVESNESIPPQGAGVGNRAQPPKASGNVSQSEWEHMSQSERENMLSAA